MKIYTSYFANMKNLEEAGIYCVSVVCKVPNFFNGPNIESVAPSKSILYEYKQSAQTEEDWEHYKQRYYNEILTAYRFHPEYLIGTLKFMSGGKDIALLCYENNDDGVRCHRHLLADWFNEKIPGLNIEEYPIYPKPKKEQKLISEPLF